MAPIWDDAIEKRFLMLMILQGDIQITRVTADVASTMGATYSGEYLRMPGSWDSDAERRLLLCLIDTNIKPEWAVVSKSMGDFTAEACRQKFYKLKREAESMTSASNGTGDPAPVTPVKKAKSTQPKSTSGKGRKRKTDAADGNEDTEMAETPGKKSKVKKTQPKKDEPVDEPSEGVDEETAQGEDGLVD